MRWYGWILMAMGVIVSIGLILEKPRPTDPVDEYYDRVHKNRRW